MASIENLSQRRLYVPTLGYLRVGVTIEATNADLRHPSTAPLIFSMEENGDLKITFDPEPVEAAQAEPAEASPETAEASPS